MCLLTNCDNLSTWLKFVFLKWPGKWSSKKRRKISLIKSKMDAVSLKQLVEWMEENIQPHGLHGCQAWHQRRLFFTCWTATGSYLISTQANFDFTSNENKHDPLRLPRLQPPCARRQVESWQTVWLRPPTASNRKALATEQAACGRPAGSLAASTNPPTPPVFIIQAQKKRLEFSSRSPTMAAVQSAPNYLHGCRTYGGLYKPVVGIFNSVTFFWNPTALCYSQLGYFYFKRERLPRQ